MQRAVDEAVKMGLDVTINPVTNEISGSSIPLLPDESAPSGMSSQTVTVIESKFEDSNWFRVISLSMTVMIQIYLVTF